jgi:deazaflavin-dependent oxidoreductase (nitroreductase family)
VRRALARFLWRLHRWTYRATGGRLGGRLLGFSFLLLTTTGRRTGRPHTVGLTYFPHGTGYGVIGSNGGAPDHPDWILNLRADPQAVVQVGNQHVAVRARDATENERRPLWARATAAYPGYEAYQRQTRRIIPIMVLEPRPSSVLYDRD